MSVWFVKPEDRNVREAIDDVVGVESGDVGDHEIGRVHAVGRLEAVPGNERLELAPDQEIDPTQQDRRHARIRI